MIEKKIIYFEKPGKENTTDCINVVKERVKEGDIKYVIVASGTGETAIKLHEAIKDLNVKIICVTYNAGYKKEKIEAFNKNIPEIEKRGITYIRSAHALSAGEKSIIKEHNGMYPLILMANTYRTISAGIKVAVEISLMATDAGKVPGSEKILCIGGSSSGCDTAVILNSSYSHTILQELKINEILCMPLNKE